MLFVIGKTMVHIVFLILEYQEFELKIDYKILSLLQEKSYYLRSANEKIP